MYYLGRVVGWFGWLWVLAGIFGQVIGQLPQLNIFPGFIFILMGRAFRQRGERRPMEPLGSGEVETVPDRPLLTDRQRPAPAPVPPRPEPIVYQLEPEPEVESSDREDLLKQVLASASEVAIKEEQEPPGVESHVPAPLSSAEMIAQARNRFNKKPTRD